jgi:hypothetical protein
MAKSQKKSKWLKKFRAIKRENNKVKELLILNKILANGKKNDEEMGDAYPVADQPTDGKKNNNLKALRQDLLTNLLLFVSTFRLERSVIYTSISSILKRYNFF